jgi:hypothetical protein
MTELTVRSAGSGDSDDGMSAAAHASVSCRTCCTTCKLECARARRPASITASRQNSSIERQRVLRTTGSRRQDMVRRWPLGTVSFDLSTDDGRRSTVLRRRCTSPPYCRFRSPRRRSDLHAAPRLVVASTDGVSASHDRVGSHRACRRLLSKCSTPAD